MVENEFIYKDVYLEIYPSWKSKVVPLIDFVLDNGGVVGQVKEKFFGLRFYYDRPFDGDDDVWDAFDEMVRFLENRSGDWPRS
jgi:hypothetical protein